MKLTLEILFIVLFTSLFISVSPSSIVQEHPRRLAVTPTTISSTTGHTNDVLFDCASSPSREIIFKYRIGKQFGGSSTDSRFVGLNVLYLNTTCPVCNPQTNYPFTVTIHPSINQTFLINSISKGTSQYRTPYLLSFYTPSQEFVFNVTAQMPCDLEDMQYSFQLTLIWQDAAQPWVVALLAYGLFGCISITSMIIVGIHMKRSKSHQESMGYISIHD